MQNLICCPSNSLLPMSELSDQAIESGQVMRTGNPAFKDVTFDVLTDAGAVMTIHGAIYRTALLLGCVVVVASWIHRAIVMHGPWFLIWYGFWCGLIGGLVLAVVTILKNDWAPLPQCRMHCWRGWCWGLYRQASTRNTREL